MAWLAVNGCMFIIIVTKHWPISLSLKNSSLTSLMMSDTFKSLSSPNILIPEVIYMKKFSTNKINQAAKTKEKSIVTEESQSASCANLFQECAKRKKLLTNFKIPKLPKKEESVSSTEQSAYDCNDDDSSDYEDFDVDDDYSDYYNECSQDSISSSHESDRDEIISSSPTAIASRVGCYPPRLLVPTSSDLPKIPCLGKQCSSVSTMFEHRTARTKIIGMPSHHQAQLLKRQRYHRSKCADDAHNTTNFSHPSGGLSPINSGVRKTILLSSVKAPNFARSDSIEHSSSASSKKQKNETPIKTPKQPKKVRFKLLYNFFFLYKCESFLTKNESLE